MKTLVVGILAHVDAGKTTLSEGLLYVGGALRKLGRVDHADAFLDTEALERERGITIFSKQAQISLGECQLTLLDTPGHVDFSAEMERTLQVLDYAILVISGTDGVQGHTRTLWRLLKQYQVPVFLFVNKMDLAGADRPLLLEQLGRELDGGCVDFSTHQSRDEGVALTSEDALSQYLDMGAVPQPFTRTLIAQRKVFPCYFGCALHLDGVEELLHGLEQFTQQPQYPAEFGAKVFKITRDGQNQRLTWLKVTGGVLGSKTAVCGEDERGPWHEKVDQLRLYSGIKFTPLDQAPAGTVCAVTGLSRTAPGQGLGAQAQSQPPLLKPVLTYQLILPQGADPHQIMPKLRQLEEEDPLLRIVWNERWKEIHVQVMGPIQLEVLQQIVFQRFGLKVDFGGGSIVYQETILSTVEGVGHFEPLRHYAEVHLLLEPGTRGSGIRLASACSGDALDVNWQHLVLTHLMEREHPGVLTGSPITDIKITLVAGRGHLKHTEGGDFRQATYRAVRQGLMQSKCAVLEPFYDFRLELPPDCVGRAMTDLQGMGGRVEPPQPGGELSLLTGYASVAGLRNYWQEVSSYTRGRGTLFCTLRGYELCHNQQEVVTALGYDPERDVDNPADSVFCENGGGFTVKWDQVRDYMHVDSGLTLGESPAPAPQPPPAPGGSTRAYAGSLEQDKQLQALFERTYGKVERGQFQTQRPPARTTLDEQYDVKLQPPQTEYLLVDGYNIIFAWQALEQLARQDVAAAREALVDILSNYQGFRKCVVILVFDAYKVKSNPGSVERRGDISVVYTKEAETADAYIEKITYDLSKNHRVRVATSDGLEQLIILGHGALRLSARAFQAEVEQAQGEIAQLMQRHNQKNRELGKVRHTAHLSGPPGP